ncbi:MAG: hypothetical protein LBS41_00435 [Streptococcaceae bacterium]|nr:hypothetical protein [Streptococcaceae bacterium]
MDKLANLKSSDVKAWLRKPDGSIIAKLFVLGLIFYSGILVGPLMVIEYSLRLKERKLSDSERLNCWIKLVLHIIWFVLALGMFIKFYR